MTCALCSLNNADMKHYKNNLASSNLVTPNELTMNPRLNQSIFIILNRPNFPSCFVFKELVISKKKNYKIIIKNKKLELQKDI